MLIIFTSCPLVHIHTPTSIASLPLSSYIYGNSILAQPQLRPEPPFPRLPKLDRDMIHKCSHCGHNEHNSRTCLHRSVKLFGVHLTLDRPAMVNSISNGNLSHCSCAHNQNSTNSEQSESGTVTEGHLSDGLAQSYGSVRDRKKGVPWTEEEHRMFLLGLEKLGKGDWRGISRKFVPTRTPTQVASHAQKYFLRQSNVNKRKRRSRLFDISSELVACSVDASKLDPKSSDLASISNAELSLGPSSLLLSSSLMSRDLADNFSPSNAQFFARTAPHTLGIKPTPDNGAHQRPLPFDFLLWPNLETQDMVSSSDPSSSDKPALALEKNDKLAETSTLALSIGPPSDIQASPVSVKLEQLSTHRALLASNTSPSVSSRSIRSVNNVHSAIPVI